MEALKYFINAQFGRILLALAIAVAAVIVFFNRPLTIPPELVQIKSDPIHVSLDRKALALASSEVFYAPGKSPEWLGATTFVFVPEKIVVEFKPVNLDIPPMGVMRPPQILTEPGPALDGAHKLPRWGEEFPPIKLADPANAQPRNVPANVGAQK